MCLPPVGVLLQLGTWGDQLLLGLSSLICKMGLPILSILSIPGGSAGKESACNVGDLGSIPELGRSPGEGKGCSLQYSGLENSMDCIVRGVAKSWTGLSSFHFHPVHGDLLWQ